MSMIDPWTYPRFFTLRIIIVDPFFIVSYNLIQKLLLLWRERNEVRMVKRFRIINSDNSCGNHLSSFLIFPIACKRSETIDLPTFNASANSSSVRIFQQCLQFGIFEVFWLWFLFFKITTFESSKVLTCFNWSRLKINLRWWISELREPFFSNQSNKINDENALYHVPFSIALKSVVMFMNIHVKHVSIYL